MDMGLIKIIDTWFGIPLVKLFSYFKKKHRKPTRINKILLMKFFGFGNLIMISPSFKRLKEEYPNAKIHFLTLSQNKQILESYSNYIDTVHYLRPDLIALPFETLKTIIKLRIEGYDLLIDFDQFARFSALVSFLINPRFSIGFKTRGQKRQFLYDETIEYTGQRHVVEEFFDLLSLLNIKKDRRLVLVKSSVDKEDKEIIDEFLEKKNVKKTDLLIGIHVGVGQNAPVRKWPIEYFIDLCNKILKTFGGSRIIFTGSRSELNDISHVAKNIERDVRDNIIIAPQINLSQLAYLIERTKIYISSDTGPLHLAAAQNVFVIGLYGPNTPRLYCPYTDKKIVFYKDMVCSPCITNFNVKSTSCKDPICMKSITPDEVFGLVKKVIAS